MEERGKNDCMDGEIGEEIPQGRGTNCQVGSVVKRRNVSV